MFVLGLSGHYHDSAACLIEDGVVVSAVAEERLSRVKHDARLPILAAKWCLADRGVSMDALDAVAYYEKPLVKFDRILTTVVGTAPMGLPNAVAALPVWLRSKLWVKGEIRKSLGYRGPIYFTGHHEAHAASAFYASPFETAATLTLDGVGEWDTTTIGRASHSGVRILERLEFPHSPGLLYATFTALLGFQVNSDEYKVMGLAAYGKPRHKDAILREVVDLRPDGSFALDARYFGFTRRPQMPTRKLEALLGLPRREPESPILPVHADIAASIQSVTEDIVLAIAQRARDITGESSLCMAGGVALNSVANGHLRKARIFERIYIQPAAGDDGAAMGAAAIINAHLRPQPIRRACMDHAYLGPQYSDAEMARALTDAGLDAIASDDAELLPRVAKRLAAGNVVGWFQGRAEWGPRALGNRSILADPRDPAMKERVNSLVKFREGFRPFAPAVPFERASEIFDLDGESPFMLEVVPVREAARKLVPAITHEDGTARVQTVRARSNPRFHALLLEFDARAGVPVLMNTSFNVRGEPIVTSPADAIRTFLGCGIDLLAMGPFVVERPTSPSA